MAKYFPIRRRFQIFFALQFAGVAMFMPYVALYLSHIGLSGAQIGILLGMMPLVAFLTQPLWGLLSDIYNLRRTALTIGCLGVALSVAAFGLTAQFYWLFLITLVMAVMRGPIMPISTALALEHLENEKRKDDFGALRLWGSIGFILTSLLMGLIIEDFIQAIVILYSTNMFIVTLLSLTLPDAPISQKANWRDGATLLKREPVLATFLAGALFVGMTMGIVNQYLAVYMRDIAATGFIIGLAMAISALPEIPLMAIVPKMMARWGLRAVLLGGIAVLPIRWFLYSIIDNPLLVLPIQLFHGIGMTAMLVVGVIYVDRLLIRQWRATGQALYTATMHGVGSSIGLFSAGFLYDYGGINPVWIFCTIIGLTGLAIITYSVRMPSFQQAVERSRL